jgi:hypothetical protein
MHILGVHPTVTGGELLQLANLLVCRRTDNWRNSHSDERSNVAHLFAQNLFRKIVIATCRLRNGLVWQQQNKPATDNSTPFVFFTLRS